MVFPTLTLRVLLTPLWRLCGAGATILPVLLAIALGQTVLGSRVADYAHATDGQTCAELRNVTHALTTEDANGALSPAVSRQHSTPAGTQLTDFDPTELQDAEEGVVCASGEREEDPEAPTLSYVRAGHTRADIRLGIRTRKAVSHGNSRLLLDWLHEQRAPRGPPIF
jgi:hypothetical protein